MGACKKPSLVVYVILLLLSFFISLNNATAQDFLKRFLSNSLIKKGKEYKSDGDYPSAITAFTKSIKRKPENLEAYYQLGLLFEEVMHNYDKTISNYKNVI
ncbi:MAG: tetratricopeptide repeat protein [Planctomycetota bacterium]|jgi:tetratricopeptide (TPR) repeat protein